jgi:CubicO group peptidase (beta-lactamase class C family)
MNDIADRFKAAGMSGRRLEGIRPVMQSYVDRGVYAGISTLISRRGKIVHAEQFGWRDKEAQSPMSGDTIFRFYSMTKPIVCVGLMTLLEEGQFTLLDPLAKYIPTFGGVKVRNADGSLVNPTRPIMLRDLMTHTSGLTYPSDEGPVGKMYAKAKLLDARYSLGVGVDDLAQFPLAFQPGSCWRYSVGIDVIGRVIEVISGRSLGEFLHGRLFEPLGMVDTAFEVPPEKRHRLAVMYSRPDAAPGGLTVSSKLDASAKGVNERLDVSKTYPVDSPKVFVRGGYGLFGTTSDYWRFAEMLANGGQLNGTRILGRKTVEFMHSNHLPPALLPLEIDGILGCGFGLGSLVLIDVAQSGVPGSVGSFGWFGAAKTDYWVDPQEELVVLFMAQSMRGHELPELELRALAYQAIDD